MIIIYNILVTLLITIHVFPFIKNQYWIFRVCDFIRIQAFILQIFLLISGLVFIVPKGYLYWSVTSLLLIAIIHNLSILWRYTPMYAILKRTDSPSKITSSVVSILSVNVYQYNKEYHRLIDLICDIKPDIVFTVESDLKWEQALSVIEREYPATLKIPQDNTYGMHFYSRLEVEDLSLNRLVSSDIPSIEAKIKTKEDQQFTLYGIHPPPPSPTEEQTSKERDGELMALAKKLNSETEPVIVVGDFNNVAWSRSSQLFRKKANLIDPRMGHGFVSSFPAKWPIMRFPIDLFYHSSNIKVRELKTLQQIGSDHLPVYCRFVITPSVNTSAHHETFALNPIEEEVVDKMMNDGKKEKGNRPSDPENKT